MANENGGHDGGGDFFDPKAEQAPSFEPPTRVLKRHLPLASVPGPTTVTPFIPNQTAPHCWALFGVVGTPSALSLNLLLNYERGGSAEQFSGVLAADGGSTKLQAIRRTSQSYLVFQHCGVTRS